MKPTTARLTKEDQKAMSCDGKEPFKSYKLAQRIARRQNRRGDEKVGAYSCQFCDGFHIGSSIGRNKPRFPTATEEEWEEMDFIDMVHKLNDPRRRRS